MTLRMGVGVGVGVVWHRLVSSSEAFLLVPVERKGSRVDGGCPTRGAGIEVARRMRDEPAEALLVKGGPGRTGEEGRGEERRGEKRRGGDRTGQVKPGQVRSGQERGPS